MTTEKTARIAERCGCGWKLPGPMYLVRKKGDGVLPLEEARRLAAGLMVRFSCPECGMVITGSLPGEPGAEKQ